MAFSGLGDTVVPCRVSNLVKLFGIWMQARNNDQLAQITDYALQECSFVAIQYKTEFRKGVSKWSTLLNKFSKVC